MSEQEEWLPVEDPGVLPAVGRGIMQGVTFGFQDELQGLASAAAEAMRRGDRNGFLKNYLKFRDLERQANAQASAQHPIAYGIGDIGSTLGAPIGVGGKILSKGTGMAAKAANYVGQKLMPAAMQSAAIGLGNSTADITKGEVPQAAAEAATAGLFGAGMAGGLDVAGKVAGGMAKAGNWFAEKGAKKALTSLGLNEKNVEHYLKNPDRVNMAPGREEMSHKIVKSVDDLKNKVIKGSEEATSKIPDDLEVDVSDIKNLFQDLKQQFSIGITPNNTGSLKKIEKMESNFHELLKLQPNQNMMSGKDVKKVIKDLDRSIDFNQKAGTFMTPESRVQSNLRHVFDQKLKNAPGAESYKEAMQTVANHADTLSRAQPLFDEASKTSSKLDSIARSPEKRISETQALKDLGDAVGDDFHGKNLDRFASEGFEKSNMQGSRGVLMGRTLGAGIGAGLGAIVGGSSGSQAGEGAGGIAGAVAGFTAADKYGPKMGKMALDVYLKNKYAVKKAGDALSKVNAVAGMPKPNLPAAATTLKVMDDEEEEWQPVD